MANSYDGVSHWNYKAMHNTLLSQILTSEPSLGVGVTIRRGGNLSGVIEKAADEFLLVEDGAVFLFAMNDTGERFYLSIIGAGYVFTPQSIALALHSKDRINSEAISDVKVRRISKASWETVNRTYPNLYNCVIEQEAQQLQIVQFHLAQHVQRSSLDRTRFALCCYALGIGLTLPCGSKAIKVSRAELATWIGVSSDRMCRLIRELHAAGEVTISGRSIKVSTGLMTSLFPALHNPTLPSVVENPKN